MDTGRAKRASRSLDTGRAKRASRSVVGPFGPLPAPPPSLSALFALQKVKRKETKSRVEKGKLKTHTSPIKANFSLGGYRCNTTRRKINKDFRTAIWPMSRGSKIASSFAFEILVQRWPIINLLPVISSCGSGNQPRTTFSTCLRNSGAPLF